MAGVFGHCFFGRVPAQGLTKMANEQVDDVIELYLRDSRKGPCPWAETFASKFTN
jgi:hypothetical protein